MTDKPTGAGLATRSIHGHGFVDAHGSPHPPVYDSTTFGFDTTADLLDVVDGVLHDERRDERPRPNAGGHPVPNECDLLFTFNNTLYIMECKVGLGFKAKQLFEDSVYKLAALRNEFGQRVEAAFLTLSNLRGRDGEVKKAFLHRAQLHRVKLFDRQGVGEELEGWLRGARGEGELLDG